MLLKHWCNGINQFTSTSMKSILPEKCNPIRIIYINLEYPVKKS